MNVMNLFSLKGKVALLTGGAGLYGRQIGEALAEAGAKVHIASRSLDKLQTVAEGFRSKGLDVNALELDLADEESMRMTVKRIIETDGRLDILVNNAVTRSATNGWAHPLEEFDKSLHINASAMFFLTNLVAEEMKKHGSGSIINIGSMMGLVGVEMANYEGTDMNPNPSPIYFYEKGGMVNFTRWAASVLGPHNIRVNCINPGGYCPPDSPQPGAFIRNYSARTQLGRMANDTDLKGIIVLLASEASAYITGANIPVDGGYTAK
jgi:NAD(P)-dependent dehydrogenase (short-subunit alcohol dehydrogenase family)